MDYMELLAAIRQWLVDTEAWEWIFSGIGIPVAGWLFFRSRNNAVTVTGDINVHPAPTPAIPRLLPNEDTVFLHREKELTWLDEHLHPDTVVAVCAPGGMGKTALAARAVRSLPEARFPDGIISHSFYHQPSTDEALHTIAEAFQIEAKAGLATAVRAVLGGKKALLILDGAEAAEDLKAVLDLRGTCGVLITSRRKTDAGPLRLDLLSLPDDQAEEVLRAWGGVSGDHDAVELICGLLGGWPVALRLAGHYLHSTGEPAADYLRWLEREPFKELAQSEEHQADNAALILRRSMAQMNEDSRLILGLAGCLAFAPLATKPMTALLEGDERRSRDAVNELVNYGLLERREEGLHIGHALIHQYAADHLALSCEPLRPVAAYYIDWCGAQSAAGPPGYALLDGERAHCLRLIKACLKSELWKEVQGLVKAIYIYLDRQGYWTEKLTAVEMNLTAARKTDDRRDEGWCLNSLGYTCDSRGERDQALHWFEQSLPIRRELGDRKGEGETLNNMAAIYDDLGRYGQALEQYEQSLSIRQEVGDRKGEGVTLNNIGRLYRAQGDNEQALRYYEQCLPIWEEARDKRGEGITLNNIAAIYDAQGKPSKAVKYYEQDLAICRELGDRAGEAVTCWNIGLTYYDMGDLARAEEHIILAVQITEDIDHPYLEQYRDGLEQVLAARQGV